jgi:hypothetical protein
MKKIVFFLYAILLSVLFQFSLSERVYSQENSDDKWFRNNYRKLFFDFHTQRTAVDVAKGFDASSWADEFVKNNVQVISIHSSCQYGWRYYHKGKYGLVHPQLPAKTDIIGDIKACHERGIKVIAYFNVLISEPFVEHRPEWLARDRAGNIMGPQISLLSPYFEEMLLPQLEEYVQNYDVDAIFFDFLRVRESFDNFTRAKFKKATGKELPLNSGDPAYGAYVRWMLDEFTKMCEQAIEAIHRGNDKVLVSVNSAYTYRQPEIPPDGIGFLTLDIHPDDQVFDASYVSKYWNTLEKPFNIMNSAFLRWWGDWGVKPTKSLG